MSIHGMLYKTSNEEILEDDLIPASFIKTEEDKQSYMKQTGKPLVLFEEVEKCAKIIDCEVKDIYFSHKGMDSYYYYKFPCFVPINPMDSKALEEHTFIAETLSKQIEVRYKHFKEAIDKGDFVQFFAYAENRIHILGLTKLYWNIPEQERYKWFIEIYTLVDYGFGRIPKEIIEDAFSKRTNDHKEQLKKKLDSLTNQDEIVIYRGQQEHSTPIEKAMSWTLKPYIASRFAAFFTGEGEVFQARVKKNDIIDYLTDRKEDEILVLPENIFEVKDMEMVKTTEEIENLSNNGGVALYHHYINQFEEELFLNPQGIHGLLHMKRVLLHVISLIRELELDDFDSRILCLSALYHDIGRTNDYEDPTHGDKGWEKVVNLDLLKKTTDYYLYEEIDEQDSNIVEFIIRNHCLNDNIVWRNLKKLDNFEKERIEYLIKIFKDADNIDRVRLGDLDTRYLRLEESKKRVNFAFGLLRGVK